MPSSRGIEKPQMSASRMPTTWPRAARATARLAVTDDLPTPPLPDAMASTRAFGGTAVSGASSRAFQRARAMTAARSVGVHGRHAHLDRAHPVQRLGVADDVGLDLAAQRARGDGEGHLDLDRVALDRDAAHHPEVDDGVAQLGVDHGPQALADFLGAGVVRGGEVVGSEVMAFDSTCVAPISGRVGPVVRARERRR